MTAVRRLRATLLAAVLALTGPALHARADGPDPCAVTGVERIVAVADVHGGYAPFVAILKAAGVIGDNERWAAGRTHFVQVGDVLDRGPDSRKALDLLKRLQDDAARAGGRVYPLMGNHEAMRMLSDMRYVSAGEYVAFQTNKSQEYWDRAYKATRNAAEQRAKAAGEKFDETAYRTQFQKEIPLGFLEMREAFGPEGEYGKWLRQQPATAKINGVQFLHGGVSPAVAPLGCTAINATVHADLTTDFDKTREAPTKALATREDGPLWYRGLAQQDEAAFAPQVDAILSQLGARAIVIGHTVAPNGTIRVRFSGRVFQIDTGMLDTTFFPGGKPSALEITGDTVTAIYTDRREVVATLATAASPR
jgi:calcineurin-like phosphoesterase family protein